MQNVNAAVSKSAPKCSRARWWLSLFQTSLLTSALRPLAAVAIAASAKQPKNQIMKKPPKRTTNDSTISAQ
jgi:hypothetical protein